MSQQLMAQYGAAILGAAVSNKSAAVQQAANTVYGVGAQYGVTAPLSPRKHESEADYMGLVFMTMAGYNPGRGSQLLAKDVRRKEWLVRRNL